MWGVEGPAANSYALFAQYFLPALISRYSHSYSHVQNAFGSIPATPCQHVICHARPLQLSLAHGDRRVAAACRLLGEKTTRRGVQYRGKWTRNVKGCSETFATHQEPSPKRRLPASGEHWTGGTARVRQFPNDHLVTCRWAFPDSLPVVNVCGCRKSGRRHSPKYRPNAYEVLDDVRTRGSC